MHTTNVTRAALLHQRHTIIACGNTPHCNASAKCPGGISTCQDGAKYNAKYNANPGGITTYHGGGKYICKRR